MRGKSCFVDTNIWLYAFIKSEDNGKTALAEQLIKSHKVVASSQVVNELCVNLIKCIGISISPPHPSLSPKWRGEKRL